MLQFGIQGISLRVQGLGFNKPIIQANAAEVLVGL